MEEFFEMQAPESQSYMTMRGLDGFQRCDYSKETIMQARTLYENKNREMDGMKHVTLRNVADHLWHLGYVVVSPGQLARWIFSGSRKREEPLVELTPYALFTVLRLWLNGWRYYDILAELQPAWTEPPPGCSKWPLNFSKFVI